MTTIIFSILLSTSMAHASLKNWFDKCISLVSMVDPYPYAEEPTNQLIQAYRTVSDEEVLHELTYRYRAGMMSFKEQWEYWDAIREKD